MTSVIRDRVLEALQLFGPQTVEDLARRTGLVRSLVSATLSSGMVSWPGPQIEHYRYRDVVRYYVAGAS